MRGLTSIRIRGALGTALALALLLPACGTATSRGASDEPDPTLDPSPETIMDMEYPSLNELVHSTDAAVIATLSKIGDPRWNSSSGQRPEDSPSNRAPVLPWVYRDVEIHVEAALWANDRIPASAGDRLTVLTLGDGSATGAIVEQWRENEISGPLIEGERYLLLLNLRRLGIIQEDRTADFIHPVSINANFLGSWRIDGATAVSLDPQRTVPLEDLKARLLEEHARGPDPLATAGKLNPLDAG